MLENSHQALLLARLVDLVARWDSKHFSLLAVIHVVPAKKRYRRSLCDKYHIPTRGEPQETYQQIVSQTIVHDDDPVQRIGRVGSDDVEPRLVLIQDELVEC